MATENDLRTFISAKRSELVHYNSTRSTSNHAQHSVNAAQCRDALDKAEWKLSRMMGEKRYYATKTGQYLCWDETGIRWESTINDCLSLSQEQLEKFLVQNLGSDWQSNGVVIKERF